MPSGGQTRASTGPSGGIGVQWEHDERDDGVTVLKICRRSALGQLGAMVGVVANSPALRLLKAHIRRAAERDDPCSGASVLDRVGINMRAKEINEPTLDMVTHYGFRWIRIDVSWRATEPSVGRFDFEELRRGLQAAAGRGLRVLGILDYGHPLYTRMLAPRGADEQRAFVRFSVEAVRQLGSLVTAWEVWNEPNHPRFWPPQPDVGAFTALLTEVASAIWKQNPNAVLVTGGLSTIDDRFLSALLPVVDSLGQHGTLGLGLHPYCSTPPETVVGDLRRVGLLGDDGRARSAGGVRVWLTEWGYCRGTPGVGPLRQAEWVPRIPLVGAALDVPLTVLFELRDGGPQDVPAYTCGLMSARDEPYPVATAWAAVSQAAGAIEPTLRQVPRGSVGKWSLGSCHSALVWPEAPTATFGSTPLTCGDAAPGCVTNVWEISPAREYWVTVGNQCS